MEQQNGRLEKAEQNLPEWMTREQLAEYLNVSVRTVDYWRKRRVISCFRVSRVIRFSRTQVAEDLARFRLKAIGS